MAEHYSGHRNLDIEEIRHAYESAMQRISILEDTNGTRVLKLERDLKDAEMYREADRITYNERISNLERIAEKQQQQLAEMLARQGSANQKPLAENQGS